MATRPLAAEITITGPVFDGQAEKALDAATDEVAQTLSERGVELVQQELDKVLQHPTGAYRSGIHFEASSGKIVDGGQRYGPWLAGTSSRNQKTSFKGYKHWQVALKLLRREAKGVGAKVVGRNLRSNG